MIIELEDIAYETYFQHAQIEITGCCNMRCKHCRAVDEENKHLSLDEISKILDFIGANKEDDFRITVSGGEPFIHPKLVEIIDIIKQRGINEVIITTNASLITDEKLEALSKINLDNLWIQMSLDSIYPEKHDEFRGYKGAYEGVIKAIQKVKKYSNIHSSIRMSITHDTLPEAEKMIDKALDLGVDRIGISIIIPVGNGKDGTLTLSAQEKKEFLHMMARKKQEYINKIDVTTEDPLKFLVKDSPWEYCDNGCNIDESFFGGCTAAITTFNVGADGIVTPCAVLYEPIININEYDNIAQMTKAYENSEVVKRLAKRDFSGKCGNCNMRRICGGCRATAKGLTGDYMASDPTCWK